MRTKKKTEKVYMKMMIRKTLPRPRTRENILRTNLSQEKIRNAYGKTPLVNLPTKQTP